MNDIFLFYSLICCLYSIAYDSIHSKFPMAEPFYSMLKGKRLTNWGRSKLLPHFSIILAWACLLIQGCGARQSELLARSMGEARRVAR